LNKTFTTSKLEFVINFRLIQSLVKAILPSITLTKFQILNLVIAQTTDILHIKVNHQNGVNTSQLMLRCISTLIHQLLLKTCTNVQTDSTPPLEKMDASPNAQMESSQKQELQDVVAVDLQPQHLAQEQTHLLKLHLELLLRSIQLH